MIQAITGLSFEKCLQSRDRKLYLYRTKKKLFVQSGGCKLFLGLVLPQYCGQKMRWIRDSNIHEMRQIFLELLGSTTGPWYRKKVD